MKFNLKIFSVWLTYCYRHRGICREFSKSWVLLEESWLSWYLVERIQGAKQTALASLVETRQDKIRVDFGCVILLQIYEWTKNFVLNKIMTPEVTNLQYFYESQLENCQGYFVVWMTSDRWVRLGLVSQCFWLIQYLNGFIHETTPESWSESQELECYYRDLDDGQDKIGRLERELLLQFLTGSNK